MMTEATTPASAARAARNDTLACMVLLALGCLLLSFGLGAGTLSYPDEIKAAERAREFLVTGDWWTVHLGFAPSFNKPPLQYWLVAAALDGGVDPEFAVRVWSALAASATLMLTALLGRAAFGRGAPTLALVLCFAPLIPWGRTGVLDAGLMLGCTLVFALWHLAKPGAFRLWSCFLLAGLAAWQKVPLALGLLAVLVLLGWRQRSPAEPRRVLLGAAIAGVALACGWPLLQWWRHGQAYWLRLFESELLTFADRPFNVGPLTYPWLLLKNWLLAGAVALGGAFLLLRTARAALAAEPTEWRGRLLAAAAVCSAVYILVAGFVPGHSPRYLLPVLPLLALCATHALEVLFRRLPTAAARTGVRIAVFLPAATLALAHLGEHLAAPMGPSELAQKLSTIAATRPQAELVRAKATPADVEPPTPFFEFYGALPRALVDVPEEDVCRLLRDGRDVVALARETALPALKACARELEVSSADGGFVVVSTR